MAMKRLARVRGWPWQLLCIAPTFGNCRESGIGTSATLSARSRMFAFGYFADMLGVGHSRV
jgi:hypothetical protein